MRESDITEADLVDALNRGDRKTLLAAEGRAAFVVRLLARGHGGLIKRAALRLDFSDSEILGPWLLWLASPSISEAEAARIAERVIATGRSKATLGRQEIVAWELQGLQDRGDWKAWDRLLNETRVSMPWHPRLAIAEARGQRARDRERAYRMIAASLRLFPEHMTLGQMLGEELVWARQEGLLTFEKAEEMWTPLDRLLSLDPCEHRLGGALIQLCGIPEDRSRRGFPPRLLEAVRTGIRGFLCGRRLDRAIRSMSPNS